MPWIKVTTDLTGHPKLVQLEESMGWSQHEALGRLVNFWLWVLQYREDGILDNSSQVARGFGVVLADGERLVKVLVECRLLDENPLRVHDWLDFAENYLYAKFHNSNPDRFREIIRRHGKDNARTNKGYPKGQRRDNFTSKSISVSESQSGKEEKGIVRGKGGRGDSGVGNEDHKLVPIAQRIEGLRHIFEDQEFVGSLRDAYPHVVLAREQKCMEAWIRATPEKSNKKNWKKFVLNWCQSERTPSDGRGRLRPQEHDREERARAFQKITKKVVLPN